MLIVYMVMNFILKNLLVICLVVYVVEEYIKLNWKP